MANRIIGSFTIKITNHQNQYEIQALDPNNVIVTEPHPFIWLPNTEQKNTLRLFQDPIKVQRVSLLQLTNLGQAMYQAVFTPGISMALGRAQALLKESNGIRIRLLAEPSELTHLPWELMHDGHDFIALRSNYPFVRGTKDVITIPDVAIRGKLNILYAWACPEAEPDLELKESAEKIKTLLATNNKINFDILENATLTKLQSKLLEEDYHILCFAGHGTTNSIYLQKVDDEYGDKISSLTLARAIEGKPTRLVFLAACETAKSMVPGQMTFAESLLHDANKTKANLPSVVAMQYIVGDDTANPLTARFFEALASFRSVDAALSEARKSILDEQRQNAGVTRDVFAPVLYLQSESSNLFHKAFNWPAIVFAIAFVIAALLGLIALSNAITSSVGETEARATAVAEATQRAYAQVGEAEARATAVAEATQRANAEIDRGVKEREALSFDLAKQSTDALQQLNIEEALGYAIQAVETTYKVDGTYTGAAEAALYQVLINGNNPVLAGNNNLDSINNAGSSPVFQIRDNTGRYHVTTARFSPDGNYILTSKGSDVGLWDMQGNLKTSLDGIHGTSLMSASFANDGSFFVTRELLDDVLRIWNTNGQLQVEFCTEIRTDCDSNAHGDIIEDFAISPDGQQIVTIHNDLPLGETQNTANGRTEEGSARLWTIDGQFVSEMNVPTDTTIQEAQFFPDGLKILTSSGDGTAQVWDLDGNLLWTLDHGGTVNMFVISPDGKYIVSAGRDGKVNIWDNAGSLYQILTLENHVESVQFSSNNFHILTVSTDVRLWDINGNLITVFDSVFDAIFNPDGTRILTLSSKPQLWNLEGQLIENYNINSNELPISADFSLDGRFFLTRSRKGVLVWNVNDSLMPDLQQDVSATSSSEVSQTTGQDAAYQLEEKNNMPLATLTGHTGDVYEIIYSPTQKQFITLSRVNQTDGNILLWDENGNLVSMFQGRTESVLSAEFNADGTRILTVNDGKVRLWENDGSLIAVLGQTDHFNVFGTLWAGFNKTGENIVTGVSGVAYLWDNNGNIITNLNQTVENRMLNVFGASFSPSGHTLATRDGESVHLWNMDGNIIATLDGHGVFFSPDDQRILTGTSEGKAWLWDHNGNLITELEGHQSFFSKRAFSISGQLFATGDSEGNAFLWNYEGERISRINSGSYQFNLDGTRLLSIEYGGEVTLWDNKGALLGTYDESSWRSSSFEPMANRFITVIEDKASLWDTDGNLIKVLDEHIDRVGFVRFSPDGTKLVTGDGYIVYVWDISGNLLTEIDEVAYDAKFSNDSTKILITTEDNLQLWNDAGDLLSIFEPATETRLSAAHFNPTETRILANTDNNSVVMWKMEHFAPVALPPPVQIRFQDISPGVVEFSASGELIFMAGTDRNTREFGAYLWDKNGNNLMFFDGHNQSIGTIAMSPDESLFVTAAGRGGVARLWHRDGTEIALMKGESTFIVNVLFNVDGTRILTVNHDDPASLWDTQGNLISVLDGYVADRGSFHAGFSPNGEFVVTAGCTKLDAAQNSCVAGAAHLWDSGDGHLITILPGLDEDDNTNSERMYIDFLTFAPDDTRFAVYVDDWYVWDYSGNSVSSMLESIPRWVESATYSPNGVYFAAAGYNWNGGAHMGAVTIWNSEGNIETIINLAEDDTDITSVHFNSTGDHLITSHVDGKSRLWGLDGTLIATLEGGRDAIFSPSGDRIVTVSEDGIVRLWGISGVLLFAYQGHLDPISSVTFSPNGTRLLTVGGETTLLWGIYPDIDTMLTEAKNRLSTFIPDYTECYTEDGSNERIPECFEAVYEDCLVYLGYTGCGESQGRHIGAEYQVNGTFKFNDPQTHIWQFDREETEANLSLEPSENLDLTLEVYDAEGQLINSSDSGLVGNVEHIDGITLQTNYTIVVHKFNENNSGDYVLFIWPSDE